MEREIIAKARKIATGKCIKALDPYFSSHEIYLVRKWFYREIERRINNMENYFGYFLQKKYGKDKKKITIIKQKAKRIIKKMEKQLIFRTLKKMKKIWNENMYRIFETRILIEQSNTAENIAMFIVVVTIQRVLFECFKKIVRGKLDE